MLINFIVNSKRSKTKLIPLSLLAIVALLVQSFIPSFVTPALATYTNNDCKTLSVWSMGYWKTHESEWVLPQTLGDLVIATPAEAANVFNNYPDSPANKVRGQLLALKFNIASGAGAGYVPGDVITLSQLADEADDLLQKNPPASDAELISMASKIEQVNTAITVSTCLTNKATLIVKKKVINDNGGTKQSSDFTMTVSAVNPSQTSFPGNYNGTTVIVDPGSYAIDEINMSGYTKSLTSSCSGTIAAGETKTCTVTNNDNPVNFCELQITKEVDKLTANPGDILTYTINFKNIGTANCTGGGVKVQDTVDTRLQYLSETHSSNVDAGYGSYPVYQSSILRWNAHELTPGESGQVSWQAKVKPISSCGLFDIPNTAQITASELNWQWVLSNTVHTVVDIICPATLIVKKHVINDNGGTKQAADFALHVDGDNASPADFPGDEGGISISLNPGNYSVSENNEPNYSMTASDDCSGTIAAGETKTCTVTNNDNPQTFCRLEITKQVDKTNANPGDTLTYTVDFINTGTANCTGGGVKVQDVVDPRLEFLSESHTSNVDEGYGGNPLFDGSKLRWNAHELTPGESGQVSWQAKVKPISSCGLFDIPNTAQITASELNWQWVLSNTVHTVVDIVCQAEIIVKKHVVNDNGGQSQASDFTMLVNAVNPSQSSFPGDEAGVSVIVEPGAYSVDEQTVAGYDKTLSADCAGTIAHGETKTCTITNDDNSSIYCELEITKQVDKTNANPGDTLVYSLHIENTGTGVCTGGGVKVQDLVDPRLEFISENHTSNISGGYGAYPLFDGSMLRWNAHELTPGETGDISWQASVKEIVDCGLFDIPNTARITASELNWQWVLSNTVHTVVDIACQANLIVKKIVLNDDGGIKQPADFTMHVAGNNPSPANFSGSATGTNVSIELGAYSVSETQDPAYAMTASADCAGTIYHGETKTCTITNDDIPPEEAKLIVVKHVINDNNGTKLAGDFTLDVTAAGNFQTDITGSETGTELSVEPGGYLVVENDSLGYSVIYDNCQGTIAAGETKTCTVTNDDPVPPPPDPAYIIVIKHVNNDDGGSKVAADFTMHLEAGNGALNTSFPGAEDPGVKTQVPVGDFNVTEDQDAGYTMTTSGDCTGTIAAGETKTCTIVNSDVPPPPPEKGKLIIIKHVINDDGGTKVAPDFSILVQAANNYQNIYAGQEAPGVMATVDPGDYTITELDSLGYVMTTSGDCAGTIAAKEIKTCTITNDDPTKATLIVIKHVINDNGHSNVAADFTMSVAAQNPSQTSFAGSESGVSIIVDPGNYNVDEVGSLGYNKSLSSGCSGTIAAGETKTCTITNDDTGGGGGCVGPNCGGGGGGCTGASCNPNPSPVNAAITCGPNATLSFTYGSDITGISLADNINFTGATSISPVASLPWTVPAGNGQTVYVKFQRNTGSIEIRQATTSNCTPPGEVLSCTNLVTAEGELVKSANQTVVNQSKGKLLIQTDAHGEIWYVHYLSGLKYYIPGSPNTTTVIKAFADGITNDNLYKIPLGLSQNIAGADTDSDNLPDIYEEAIGTSALTADTDSDGFTDYVELQNGYNPLNAGKPDIDESFASQQKGRFFLQTEGAGQVWYVSPQDGKRYYIPSDATNAFNVIASLAQGMGNGEIRQISVGQEINGVDTSVFATCYSPTPTVLGITDELPRTGFPFDLAQLVIIPGLAAYPWLKRRYSSALGNYFGKLAE